MFALLGILGMAITLAITACFIPDNPYLRFQNLKADNQFRNLQWIYERIHFDITPFDVVFIGPSNILLGIDSRRMNDDLHRRGLTADAVNFSIPSSGRNLNYVIIKEIYKTQRRPKLLLIGLTDKPGRFFGHPVFKYFAEVGDVAEAAFLINLSYLPDLSYLPFRQMKLTAMQRSPKIFDVRPRFDPVQYHGSDYDPGSWWRELTARITLKQLKAEHANLREKYLKDVSEWKKGNHPPIFPATAADIEFGVDNFYIRKIVALAQENGTKIGFLYIPIFHGPAKALEDQFYSQYGPVLNADFVTDRHELFADFRHLNDAGAIVVTDWLADHVAFLLANSQESH